MKRISANCSKYILESLEILYPEAKTELENWKTEIQFLICIVLSAQTTDNQVNKVTKFLFERYSSIEDFANADVSELEKQISSVNYYKTKAKHIIYLSKCLKEQFNSDIPKNVEDLIKLPGVGKKTANVFLNELFRANQGIAVDTHVARVAKRLALTDKKNPDAIALDLEKEFRREDWYKVNTRFVLFGRYHCKAQKPLCDNCVFADICEFQKASP